MKNRRFVPFVLLERLYDGLLNFFAILLEVVTFFKNIMSFFRIHFTFRLKSGVFPPLESTTQTSFEHK